MFAISLVDSITVIVAILSSIAAGLNALCAIKMFGYVKNANEIKINEMISNSYNQMLSLLDTQKTKYVIKNCKRKKVFYKTYKKGLIIENYFNTMDMACNCYL